MSHDRVFVIIVAMAGCINLASGRCSRLGSPFFLNTMSGTIESPGFPTSYEADEACDWTLRPPPRTHPELMIVEIVKVDTDTDGLPEVHDICNFAENFVSFGRLRGCGEENGLCVAFMLSSSGLDCHATLGREFSGCPSVLHSSWPFEVTFRTGAAAQRAGFKIKYKFVTCSYEPLPEETTQAETTDPVMNFTEAETGPDRTTNAETENTTPPSGTLAVTTRSPLAIVTTTPETSLPRETKVPKNLSRAGAADDKVVIGILIALIVFLLLVAVVLARYRKNILNWIEHKKWKPRTEKRTPNGGHYAEATTISNSTEGTYEEPMDLRRPPIPPPYPPMVEGNGNASLNGNGISPGEKTTTLNGPLTITNTIYEVCE